MPAYEFDCPTCGDFIALRPMAARDDPLACPDCGAPATRIMLTAPAIGALSSAKRVAHETNERAAHQPKSSAQHGLGCACCTGTAKSASARAADGSKAFPKKRPWMISH